MMSELSKCPPLTRESVQTAHERIKPFIHLTPTLTCTTLDDFASTPQTTEALVGTEYEGQTPAKPLFKLFFKCENYQRIGAFKSRGAFHALSRLTEEERSHGVITHSSGNHAQALALAAKTYGIPAHIVMPSISTPSKIAGTQKQGANVHFSGSTAPEREARVKEISEQNPGVVFVPPYNHPNIILGQGTLALELEKQVEELGYKLDGVIGPIGGGGMLSGVATALFGTGIAVYGSEPKFQGANDAQRGVAQGKRVESVKTLTIADGLRTPLGDITWSVISDPEKVKGLYSVTEEQIKAAMKLVLERMKVVIEPSSAVPLAVVLFDEDFRRKIELESKGKPYHLGIVFTGGNTTVEAIAKLFEAPRETQERAEGIIGLDGTQKVENVAG